MPNRNAKVAEALAAMASAFPHQPKITYTPTGETKKEFGTVWHGMIAIDTSKNPGAEGRTWHYWLARDQGSYKGAFDSSNE